MWELACRAKATNSSFRLMVSLVVQGMMTSRRSWFAAKCPPCPRTPVNHVSGPYKKRKSKQNALAPPLGTSLRLGVPVIRQRGLTGRLRSQADQERLASHRGYRLLLQPTKLCRYLYPTLDSCRSELAREKLTGAAFIQAARVIVDVFREQARSYSVCACRSVCASVSRAMSRLGWPLKVWLKRICW